MKTDADFEHYWSLIEQSGNLKVTKEEAKKVWDTAYNYRCGTSLLFITRR